LARPISQALLDVNVSSASDIRDDVTKKSPFYPTGLLSVNNVEIYPSYYSGKQVTRDIDGNVIIVDPFTIAFSYDLGFDPDLFAKTRNRTLYQLFSSEIDFRRNDVLSKINTSDTKIAEVFYPYSVFSKYTNNTKDNTYGILLPDSMRKEITAEDATLYINRLKLERLTIDAKESRQWIFNFYSSLGSGLSNFGDESDDGSYRINQIKDVKIPEWNSGFIEI